MKLAREGLLDKAAAAWEDTGYSGRCGFLAGALGAAYLAGLAAGGIIGSSGFAAFSIRTDVERRRYGALEAVLDEGIRIVDRDEGGPRGTEGRLERLQLQSGAVKREADELKDLSKSRGLERRAFEDGVRKALEPLNPAMLRNVEIQRLHLVKQIGPVFPSYRLLFGLHYSISGYLTYRNTAGNIVPRDIGTIGWSGTGDCKDHSTLLASLALAAGFRVKYVSWNPEGDREGHAYLFVRIFENPTPGDMKAVEREFADFKKRVRETAMDRKRPALRAFSDGLYMACDPTNHLVPGLISDEYLGPPDRIMMQDFCPEGYGITPRKR